MTIQYKMFHELDHVPTREETTGISTGAVVRVVRHDEEGEVAEDQHYFLNADRIWQAFDLDLKHQVDVSRSAELAAIDARSEETSETDDSSETSEDK